jgi:hypothetical protein
MNSKQKKEQNRKPFFAKWANVPFAPAKWPFFYGWMIVAVATLSIVCSVPGQTAGVGVFTNHIIDTLGMTRDELSLAYMVGTLTSGFILPFSGRLLDIIGVRLMSLCVSVGLAVSLLILSQVDRLAEMLKAFFHSVSAGIPGIETLAEVLSRFFPSGLSVGAAAALACLLFCSAFTVLTLCFESQEEADLNLNPAAVWSSNQDRAIGDQRRKFLR